MNKIIAVSILSIFLLGCASTKSTVVKRYISSDESKISITIIKDVSVSVPDNQYQLIEDNITDGLKKNGLLASNQETSKHSAVVTLHSFRIRDDAARLAVGILAGCDNIISTVTVMDKLTNDEIGKSKISINECAAWGVSDQVITKYTNGVVEYLSNKQGQ